MTEILQPETEKLIAKKCQEWQCATLDDTVREAFQRIADYESKTVMETTPEWTEEQLDAELQKGLHSGKSIPAEQVFTELREQAAKRQQ